MSYANKVYLDGRTLKNEDFKVDPQGHMGGSLNMVVAYAGYMAANALTGDTRAWLMGQGHCVAAIDAINLLLQNTSPAHAERYPLNDIGLTKLVNDFYSYKITPDGRPESPLGSHVNVHTAGGIMEGGYLGFAETYYAHVPLPGEELVAFLSDGAFEEQRGSDWVPRWWRAKDCGAVIPVMIANGRRIDQRTTMAQDGGVSWLKEHLTLNNFDPVTIDGKDPAAFVWAIIRAADKYKCWNKLEEKGELKYPCHIPYTIAETIKGYGFFGAGTNASHNLPLGENPSKDESALKNFNNSVGKLFVSNDELAAAIKILKNHTAQKRPLERDNSIANRSIDRINLPEPDWKTADLNIDSKDHAPMHGIDQYFCETVKANPNLRPRVGNPDELSSNQMIETLKLLKHRVTAPEDSSPENLYGSIITALNEEAIVSAALANKGGINIAVSYEAFAVKMLGALRQEIIFARHQKEAGCNPGWLSVLIVLSSHTWENGKNEQSHQDPTLCEAMMAEMGDVSRVVFPPDFNTAMATLKEVYSSRGQIWTIVASKQKQPSFFSKSDTIKLVNDGAIRVLGTRDSDVTIGASGSYQLIEAIKAAKHLESKGIKASVVYIYEPAKFRSGRDPLERSFVANDTLIAELFPSTAKSQVFLVHQRTENFYGVISKLDQNRNTKVLGYINRGGTLDTFGMLFANRTTWAHAVSKICNSLKLHLKDLLNSEQIAALNCTGDPLALMDYRN